MVVYNINFVKPYWNCHQSERVSPENVQVSIRDKSKFKRNDWFHDDSRNRSLPLTGLARCLNGEPNPPSDKSLVRSCQSPASRIELYSNYGVRFYSMCIVFWSVVQHLCRLCLTATIEKGLSVVLLRTLLGTSHVLLGTRHHLLETIFCPFANSFRNHFSLYINFNKYIFE